MSLLLYPQLLEHVLSPWLKPDDLVKVGATCKALRSIVSRENQAFWHRVFLRLWPECTHSFSACSGRPHDTTESEIDPDEFDPQFLHSSDDVCDWHLATVLRFGLLHRSQRKTIQECLRALSFRNDMDEADLAVHAQSMLEREMNVLNYERGSQKWRDLLARYQCSVGLVALQYRNRSDSSISGVCNFFLISSVALFFPQSAYPLIISMSEYGSGYRDDPTVDGMLCVGWDSLKVFCLSDEFVAPVVSKLRLLHRPSLTFRSLKHRVSLPSPRPSPFAVGMGLPFPFEEAEEFSFRRPDPVTMLLSLSIADTELADCTRKQLFSLLNPEFVHEWREQIPLTELFLNLCQAPRGLSSISFASSRALQNARSLL